MLRTEITNTGKELIYLTCSYPLDINTYNSENHLYTPINENDLYQPQGNPKTHNFNPDSPPQ